MFKCLSVPPQDGSRRRTSRSHKTRRTSPWKFAEIRGKEGTMTRKMNKMEDMRARMVAGERGSECLQFFSTLYYDWGFNHIILIAILAAYSFLGAGVFMIFEGPAQDIREARFEAFKESQRIAFIDETLTSIFNDSEKFLLFISKEQSFEIRNILNDQLLSFERNLSTSLDIGHIQKMTWDFWNAMLYSWTLITTIGYGHLYPTTDSGKIATMIYAIIGIPLMLVILNDLGKLLTKFMKYPWFVAKKWGRRLFQYCTRMSREDIRAAEERDKERLEVGLRNIFLLFYKVFDLPVVVAIAIVIGWIFICSAIQMLWENDWDYLVAFYFFFISLSTIGLGDIAPKEPKYLLIMFWNIAIGLSLVSMCISLIQTKLERTYHVGQEEKDEQSLTEHLSENGMVTEALRRVHSVPIAITLSKDEGEVSSPDSRHPSIISVQSAPEYVPRRLKLSLPRIRKKKENASSSEKIQVKVKRNKMTRTNSKLALQSASDEKNRKPMRDSGNGAKRESTVNVQSPQDKRSFLSASTASLRTVLSKQNSSSPSGERPAVLKNKESSWSLDPMLFDDDSPIDATVPVSRSFASIASTSSVVPKRGRSLAAKSRALIKPTRKAPKPPPQKTRAERAKTKPLNPDLRTKALQLKKELSQYDNVDLMGPGDILDQVRHEESLQSPRKHSFPLQIEDTQSQYAVPRIRSEQRV